MPAYSDHPVTKREAEILALVVAGNTSQQIADFLGISIHTVSNHRKSILVKTRCSNITEPMLWAVRNDLKK
jgi:DNA-binding CsgD family transcriptional regulator